MGVFAGSGSGAGSAAGDGSGAGSAAGGGSGAGARPGSGADRDRDLPGRYRATSFWLDQLAATGIDDLRPRPSLDVDAEVDVAIVGAGLTGVWTAYYLERIAPALRVAIIESEIAGFGASGRNGGWCSALFPRGTADLAAEHGREAAIAMRAAMIDTVREVGAVVAREGIDCGWAQTGTVDFARDRPQLGRALADAAEAAEYGVDTMSFAGTRSTRSRYGAPSAVASTFTPDCARVQPAALIRGLARIVESRGARIWERTRVTGLSRGRVEAINRTTGIAHTVRAAVVVNATEGYGSQLAGVRRSILPLYSLMIATEPLSEAIWDRIGIRHGETFSDYRRLIVYGQRTADNRFAFGGRGARYHLGSAIHPDYDRVDRVRHHLQRALGDLFPDARTARITHHWGGPLGVPRDWHASVGLDRATGFAWAGGYVGDGLSTTNLAGRTLADLIAERATSLTALPWVGHRSPRWEPEPLRFLGANVGLLGTAAADAEERLTRRESRVARAVGALTGH